MREFKEKQAKRQQELLQKQKEAEEKKQKKLCIIKLELYLKFFFLNS